MTAIGYIVIAAAVLAAAVVVIWDRWRTRRLLKRLDTMLEKAITRGFTEEDYDESLLSAVESKLARYLASSTVSARNLQAEKDKIAEERRQSAEMLAELQALRAQLGQNAPEGGTAPVPDSAPAAQPETPQTDTTESAPEPAETR